MLTSFVNVMANTCFEATMMSGGARAARPARASAGRQAGLIGLMLAGVVAVVTVAAPLLERAAS